MAWFVLGAAQNLGETDHNGQKHLNKSIFHKFERSSLLTLILQKIKTVGYATTNDFLMISYKPWPVKQVEERDQNGKKYLKMTIFLEFKHSSLPLTITNETENN